MKTKRLFICSFSVTIITALSSCSYDSGLPDSLDTVSTKSSDLTILIDKKEALSLASPITDSYPGQWVEISETPILANTILEYSDYGAPVDGEEAETISSPSFDAWLLVVDPDYSIDGIQNQLHIFVDVNNGTIEKCWIKGRVIMSWDESRNEYIETANEVNTKAIESQQDRIASSYDNKWAVIISGGYNMSNNYMRYWNDCQSIYLTLTQSLGYQKDQIYCIVSDGTSSGIDRRIGLSLYDSSPLDFDGDGNNDIQYAATKANISSVFTNLASSVSSGDEVLVFMTDHGGSGSGGQFYLWEGQTLTGSELRTELSKLGSDIMVDVVMGQCYSGTFKNFVNCTFETFSCSCSSGQEAETTGITGYNYYLHYWTEALTTASVDTDNDGKKSIIELSAYAKTKTVAAVSNQTPQYQSTPEVFGFGHDILGNDQVPRLTGPDYISNNENSTYILTNVPSSSLSSVYWAPGYYTTIASSNNTSITVHGNLPSNMYVFPASSITATFTYNGVNYPVVKHITSIWRPGLYSGYGYITGGNGTYMITQYPEAYGYYWWTDNQAWTILSQGSFQVLVNEGTTYDPVNLSCGFRDPLGGTIIITDTVH